MDGTPDGTADDTTTPFALARAAVAAGASARAAAADVVAAMTVEEKRWCLDGDMPLWAGLGFMGAGGYHHAPFLAAVVERVGLPGIAFSDGPRGVVIGNATCFPVAMARGATWDPALEERIGDVIGTEVRAAGATLFGGVCVNLLRHPAWGRAQETYGEDPFHVGEMGAALTRGVQRHAMATVKHFAVNSMENARFRVDVRVSDDDLHQYYLPQFRRIVDEGVACVMSAYNKLNGTYCGDHRHLLTEILREQWGFDGFVISDWIFGIRDAADSVLAGLDIEMPGGQVRMMHLADAMGTGAVTEADVDPLVTNVVATLLAFDDVLSTPAPPRSLLAAPDHVALAREVAARSAVLLRNEVVDGAPALPLAGGDRLAVVGRLADLVNLGDGGSSDVWTLDPVTVLEGIRDASSATVAHAEGSDLDAAAALAAEADATVVVVGYTLADEGEFIGDAGIDSRPLFPPADDPATVAAFEARNAALATTTTPDHVEARPSKSFSTGGDRVSVRLGADDVALIRSVAAVSDRVVVVLQSGSATLIDEWVDDVAAVVQSFYGGQQAGPGLADVLYGRVNPSARLPFTVPAHEDDLPTFDRDAPGDVVDYDGDFGWWRQERLGTAPAYPFGFGLSYTSFVLRDAQVRAGDGFDVTVTVDNTGDRDGADVVQVVAVGPDGHPPHLVGFARVEVPARGAATATIPVPRDALARWRAGSWSVVPGAYELVVRRHAGDADQRSCPVTVD